MDAMLLSHHDRRGSGRLTRRELEVLMLLGEGMSTREVAEQLFVSKRTIDFHLGRIFAKLEVANRVQAIRRAAELGLVSPAYYLAA